MSKPTKYDFERSRRDDENLTKAGNGWKEDTKDTAIELLKLIREDVED